MGRKVIQKDVFQAAYDRLYDCYKEGHRLVVSFSGGKDSGVLLEMAILAARSAGKLPVEVMFRDDEILYPGTAEYVERTAQRPEVNMHWIVNRQAAPNIYNREMPFYWCFDPLLQPEQWVRIFPDYAEEDLENINLYYLVNPQKYPNPPGKFTVAVVGIRTTESRNRLFAIQSSKGSRSYAPDNPNLFNLYPIYDWTEGDVWKAVKDNKWDYNEAYSVLAKMGVTVSRQRLSQIAMTAIGVDNLAIASRAWPKWFDKVCTRLPGIRQVVYYGDRVLRPIRHTTETWEECFYRTCVNNAPKWISDRSTQCAARMLASHAAHSQEPFPEVQPCKACKQSWKTLANALYSGDPFHIEIPWLLDVEPKMFRASETRSWPKTHK